MPSFGDTALIALLALLLFGPKKLPELARQLGKLMGEFRRASNEFRMQMEDELRIAEQAESQKKIEAMQAAAPVTPLVQNEDFVVEHPHLPAVVTEHTIAAPTDSIADTEKPDRHTETAATPLPIASAGELNMMPPATGLPASRSGITPVLDAIPQTADPEATHRVEAEPMPEGSSHEASLHG
jgi:sec-independent protein translocase protein TatB